MSHELKKSMATSRCMQDSLDTAGQYIKELMENSQKFQDNIEEAEISIEPVISHRITIILRPKKK